MALSLFALYGPGILLLLVAVIAAAVFLYWLVEGLLRRSLRIERAQRYPAEIEQSIATELEAEILRRMPSSREREA